MSLELPFGIKQLNPHSNVNEWYGPYNNISEALNIPEAVRGIGLTIGIIENGGVSEYWWRFNTTDSGLVPKLTNQTEFSGSFSGSFTGDGSGLTNISADNVVGLNLSQISEGDVVVSVSSGSNSFELLKGSQELIIVNDEGHVVVPNDLTVMGTASFQNTTNLEVADRFILLASGSDVNGDGGFVVQQNNQDIGEVFGYDALSQRWGVDRAFNASTSTLEPEAFVSLVIEGEQGEGTGDVDVRYVQKGNIFVAENEDIFIYS